MNEAAPYFADIAEGPSGAIAVWVKADDGVRLRVVHWDAPNPRGTIFLFQGRTEYAEKYGLVARGLVDRGYSTAIVDWRGQGLSDRFEFDYRQGHVREFEDYQKDVKAFLEYAENSGLPQPYYLIGHSMGGGIGLRALMEGLPVKAVGFSGPMWGIELSFPMRLLAWFLTSLTAMTGKSNQFALTKSGESYINTVSFEENDLTTDRAMFDLLQKQIATHPELALGGPSYHWLNRALRETWQMSRLPSPQYPCFIIYGEHEDTVQVSRLHQRAQRWPGATIEMLPGKRHEIMMDDTDTRTKILDKFVALFDAHR